MDWFRRAVDAGWAHADYIAVDPDFEILHGPEFDALVERARENATARRAE